MNSANPRNGFVEEPTLHMQRRTLGNRFQKLNRGRLLHPTGAQVFENDTDGADRRMPENCRSSSRIGIVAHEKIDPKGIPPSERGHLASLEIISRNCVCNFHTRGFHIAENHDLRSLNRSRPMLFDLPRHCLCRENPTDLNEQAQRAQLVEVDQRPSIENADARFRHAVRGFDSLPPSSPRAPGLRHAPSDTPLILPNPPQAAGVQIRTPSPTTRRARGRVAASLPFFVRACPHHIPPRSRPQTRIAP